MDLKLCELHEANSGSRGLYEEMAKISAKINSKTASYDMNLQESKLSNICLKLLRFFTKQDSLIAATVEIEAKKVGIKHEIATSLQQIAAAQNEMAILDLRELFLDFTSGITEKHRQKLQTQVEVSKDFDFMQVENSLSNSLFDSIKRTERTISKLKNTLGAINPPSKPSSRDLAYAELEQILAQLTSLNLSECTYKVLNRQIVEERKELCYMHSKLTNIGLIISNEFFCVDPNLLKTDDTEKLLEKLVDSNYLHCSRALLTGAGGKIFSLLIDYSIFEGAALPLTITFPNTKLLFPTIPVEVRSKVLKIYGIAVNYPLDLLHYDVLLESSIEYAFGDFFICETDDIAKELARMPELGYKAVSVSGNLYGPSIPLAQEQFSSSSQAQESATQLESVKRVKLKEYEKSLNELDDFRDRIQSASDTRRLLDFQFSELARAKLTVTCGDTQECYEAAVEELERVQLKHHWLAQEYSTIRRTIKKKKDDYANRTLHEVVEREALLSKRTAESVSSQRHSITQAKRLYEAKITAANQFLVESQESLIPLKSAEKQSKSQRESLNQQLLPLLDSFSMKYGLYSSMKTQMSQSIREAAELKQELSLCRRKATALASSSSHLRLELAHFQVKLSKSTAKVSSCLCKHPWLEDYEYDAVDFNSELESIRYKQYSNRLTRDQLKHDPALARKLGALENKLLELRDLKCGLLQELESLRGSLSTQSAPQLQETCTALSEFLQECYRVICPVGEVSVTHSLFSLLLKPVEAWGHYNSLVPSEQAEVRLALLLLVLSLSPRPFYILLGVESFPSQALAVLFASQCTQLFTASANAEFVQLAPTAIQIRTSPFN